MQLWIQPPENWGSLLVFVTGSKDHNDAAARAGTEARPVARNEVCLTRKAKKYAAPPKKKSMLRWGWPGSHPKCAKTGAKSGRR